jgi:hypothetical protein
MTEEVLELKEEYQEKPTTTTTTATPVMEPDPVIEVTNQDEVAEEDNMGNKQLLAALVLDKMLKDKEARDQSQPCGFCLAHKYLDVFLKASFVLFIIALSIGALKNKD